jgi:outer membrane receptor for ferrienterochelin and colicins
LKHGRRAAALALCAAALGSSAQQAPEPQRVIVEGKAAGDADARRLSTIAVTVVGREELDAFGDSSVLDVLQRLPGITVDGEVPKLRGLGAGYTQILINGEPAPPGFSLDTLAPADIERIEIVKGPTAEYGGVAGVINVVLRVAPKLTQREWRLNLGYRAVAPQGSTSLGWGDRIGALGFHLPIGVYTWANGADSSVQRLSRLPNGDVRSDLVNAEDAWRGRGFNLGPRLEWKLDERQTLSWQGFAQGNESDNRGRRRFELVSGPALTRSAEATDSRGLWQMLRMQLQWVQRFEDGRRFELKAAGQGSRSRTASTTSALDGAGADLPLRDTLSSQREHGATQGGRLRLPLPGAGPHALTLGWDLEHRERREQRRVFDGGVEQITTNQGPPFFARLNRGVFFVQDEWEPAPRWTALAGLRAEHLDLRTAGPTGAVDNVSTSWSPNLQLRHAFDEKARELLRLSIARSVRVPDVGSLLPRYALNTTYDRDTPNTPLAADSAGYPRLRPERSTGFDAAYELHGTGGAVTSIGVFHRRIDDLVRRRIALEGVPEASVPRWVSRPANIGSARSSGLELELKGPGEQLVPMLFGARGGVQLRAALSVYRSKVEQLDDPDARLDGQPPWSATMGFDRQPRAGAFGIGASLALSPAFSTQQTDRQRIWRSHQQRLDAYISWRLDRQLQLRLAGNNLLGIDARSSSRVEDLDGFAAASDSRRSVPRQIALTLTLRS